MKKLILIVFALITIDKGVMAQASCSASFNVNNNSGNYTFLPAAFSQGVGCGNYHSLWDFGDGTTAFYHNQPNITYHTYSSSGTYVVTLSISFLAADSSVACLAIATDTVIYNGCNIAPWITYSFQGFNMVDLSGYNSISQLPFDIGVWSVPETGFISTSSGSTGFSSSTYTFPDSGSYHLNFRIIDTIPGAICTDSTSILLYIPYFSGCAASFSMWQDTLNTGTWYGSNNSYGYNLSYLWDFGDGTTDTSAFPSHTYAALGHYDVCLTVFKQTDSCSSTMCDTNSVHKMSSSAGMSSFTVVNPLGIKNNKPETLDVTIYPNPASEALFVRAQFNKNVFTTIKNNLGEVVLEEKLTTSNSSVNISELPPGIYFISISDGEKQAVKKFIKE